MEELEIFLRSPEIRDENAPCSLIDFQGRSQNGQGQTPEQTKLGRNLDKSATTKKEEKLGKIGRKRGKLEPCPADGKGWLRPCQFHNNFNHLFLQY